MCHERRFGHSIPRQRQLCHLNTKTSFGAFFCNSFDLKGGCVPTFLFHMQIFGQFCTGFQSQKQKCIASWCQVLFSELYFKYIVSFWGSFLCLFGVKHCSSLFPSAYYGEYLLGLKSWACGILVLMASSTKPFSSLTSRRGVGWRALASGGWACEDSHATLRWFRLHVQALEKI